MTKDNEKPVTPDVLARMIKSGFDGVTKHFKTVDDRLVNLEKNMATKTDLAKVQRTLDDHTTSLDGITKQLTTLNTEKASQYQHNNRMTKRTDALAHHVGLDLSKVDAEA